MKTIANMFINVIYGACILIGYIGLLDNRTNMVIGCIVLALFGNYAKRSLKLGVYK